MKFPYRNPPNQSLVGRKRCYLLGLQASQQVKHLYSQKLSLPEVVIERSISNWGDTARLRNFFQKLRAGVFTSEMDVILMQLTDEHKHEGTSKSMQASLMFNAYKLCAMAGESVSVVILDGSITCGGDTRVIEEQWSYRVFMWIKETFPHEDHTYLNMCKSATPSMVTGACLGNYLPENIDLILIEVTSLHFQPLIAVQCRAACHVMKNWPLSHVFVPVLA